MDEELKEKVKNLLDADKDGKLSFEEAKAMALAVTKDVSSAARERLLAWLDTDGDGTISGAEAQAPIVGLWRRLAPYKHSLLASAGFICTFYGRNFKYTILFGRTFATTGWPSLKPALRELAASYERGKKAVKTHAPEIEKAKAALKKIKDDLSSGDEKKKVAVDAARFFSAWKSLDGVFAAIDPKKLLAVLKSAYVGLSASFASVLSESAAKLGVGVGLGDAIGNAINAVVAPVVARWLTRLKDRALENEEIQDVLRDVDDTTLASWVDTLISALSTALGVYVAHRVDDVIYLYSACVAGATLAVDKLAILLPPNLLHDNARLKQLAIATLATAGFVYQRILQRGHLPFFLHLPLAPFAISESILDKMAMSIRAASLQN
ncbi:hypothetical protein CTAYLR_003300 [Chrysophaeum taylorii]|uniref:EF-hand domain-containing protein n=1 Tax=Chrysophaeum taylorii TaxID=2483200 RepID=A0AAD7UH34_9STRA|nr:hypothetical protein CTAYLR_003300 [Chrysophaeum taylorii]